MKGISLKKAIAIPAAGSGLGNSGNVTIPLASGASLNVAVSPTDVVFVGSVGAFTPSLPAQQTTVVESPAANPAFTRNHRLTQEAAYCFRSGAAATVAFLRAAWTALASAVEPTLTWTPPAVVQAPDPGPVTADGVSSASLVGVFGTEAPGSGTWLGWQYLAPGGAWTALSAGGIYALAGTDGSVAGSKASTYQTTLTVTPVGAIIGSNTDSGDFTAGDYVTLGGVTYTFESSLAGHTPSSSQAYVLLGGSIAASLANLIGAVNFDGAVGTNNAVAANAKYDAVAATVSSHAGMRLVPVVAFASDSLSKSSSALGAWSVSTMSSVQGYQYRCWATDAQAGTAYSSAATLVEA